jgi:TolB-like protein
MKTEHEVVEPSGIAGDRWTAAAAVEGANRKAVQRAEKAEKRSKRKAAKLRSVWISFTGRIVAQFVGSAASILLGMTLIHNYKAPEQASEKSAVSREPVSYPGRVARVSDTGQRRRPSIVVLPIDDYSLAPSSDSFAQALAELVTASLAERGSLVVLSRTSASRIGTSRAGVPAIARELGVDLVLESSVTRSANRIRVVAQLIDGRSDEHIWAGRYDRGAGDILDLQGEIANQIARGIEGAMSDSALRPSTMASRLTTAGGGAGFDARGPVAFRTDSPVRVQQQ